jgi:hypothetical protein
VGAVEITVWHVWKKLQEQFKELSWNFSTNFLDSVTSITLSRTG